MTLNEVLNWLEKEFGYPVPEDYLNFLKKGDFESSWRKYYLIEKEEKEALEISSWFTYDLLAFVYGNCIGEGLIENRHLPIFDSCGMTVVIDCNKKGKTYGQVFVKAQDGFYDIDLEKNIYDDFEFVAISFLELISNLKTREGIQEMSIW